MVRKLCDLSAAVLDSAGRPFVTGERVPDTVEALFSLRHRPGRMVFGQERLAPPDQLIVDLPDDLCAARVVAPVRECQPAPQRRLIARYDLVDPLAQVRHRKS